MRIFHPVTTALAIAAVCSMPAVAQGDTLVTTGSPQGSQTFPQNKQNEPAVAVDPLDTTQVVAGSNDEIDLALCGASGCPFTPGVGVSGVYFSLGSSLGFTQPTYTGFSARTAPPGGDGSFPGAIGTLPLYYEAGLASDGDPTLAYGPRPDSHGHFSWLNGSRFYYGNLTANLATQRGDQTFKGFEAIAVSRSDDPSGAQADQSSWSSPVIVSQARQSSTTFSDKPTLWADNAATSRFFGRVYVCFSLFKSQQANGPAPIAISHSTDGGATWSHPLTLSPSANNKNGTGREGCEVRTDSRGRVYVFWEGTSNGRATQFLDRSDDGGGTFESPRGIANVVEVGRLDPASGDPVFDGYAGARTDSFPIADIANGAPTGQGATNKIAIAWSDARHGVSHEEALVQYSTNRGDTWSRPQNVAAPGDRPDFPSIALSPNGAKAYVVYDAFTSPFQTTTASPRPMQGVVRSAPASAGSTWTTKYRGTAGDARASSANVRDSEFIGDYNGLVATNSFAVAVFNDVRNGDDCSAIDTYRQALIDGGGTTTATAPNPDTACSGRFGNTDIYATEVTP